MTAIVPGWAPMAGETYGQTMDRMAVPTYRCTECTLMRCYVPGQTCQECQGNAAPQQRMVVCPYDGTLHPAGDACQTCASAPG
jgi:hypothetical protein